MLGLTVSYNMVVFVVLFIPTPRIFQNAFISIAFFFIMLGCCLYE